MTYSAKLDAVSKARQAYVIARTTLESRLREQMKQELGNLQTQVDIAVRYAFNAGESKAAIMRAMGIKDYNTMQASLARTEGVAQIVGHNPLDDVYKLGEDGETLFVKYVNHGSKMYNGEASFKIMKLNSGNGGVMFMSNTSLWNDSYTVRNDAVVALDGTIDGEYYEEATAWLNSLQHG
jgi:hypothetical protein